MKTKVILTFFIALSSFSCSKPDRDSADNGFVEDVELPNFTITGGWRDVDNSVATNWHRYTEPFGNSINDQAHKLKDSSAPSGDHTVFYIGIQRSDPYTNVYRYLSKPFTNEVNWRYSIRFKFRGSSYPPQALEFPFSIYTGTKRLEMAMQWVSPIESGNPRWRVWCGAQGRWNDVRPNGTPYHFRQNLTADTWHSLTMTGRIKNDTIYYDKAISDGKIFSVGEHYAGVANATPAQCVLAFQLNNNFLGSEQQVFIDDYSVIWGR